MPNSDASIESIFDPFGMWAGFAPAGFDVNFLGQLTDVSFADGWADPPRMMDRSIQVGYPALSEEIFEWELMLSAVLEAREHFTMVECGAGWGRWLISAACAFRALKRNLPMTLVGVEAEPTHFQWMSKHFRDNGVDPDRHKLINAAVSDKDGTELFMVGHPASWYGQNVVGTRDYRRPGFAEARAKPVPSRSLATILSGLHRVDLVDCDIQGSERTAIPPAMDVMTRRVKRVFVETHAPDIHQIIYDAFERHGWKCVALHGFAASPENTAYGPVTFADGVQCWVNPAID